MSCLNGNATNGKDYQHFDVENMQPGDQNATSPANKGSSSSRKGRRCCCSLPLVLALVAVLLSMGALVCGVYAAVVARKGVRSLQLTDQGVYLTSDPRNFPAGWKAVNLYKGTGYFAKQPSMLYPRSDHKTIPLGNQVYILGGLTNAAELDEKAGPAAGPTVPLVLNATVAYDTYTLKSTELAPMPQPRFRFCSSHLNGQLYVIGGMEKWEAADAKSHVVSDRVMRYTPSTNRWEVLPARLNHPRGDCCAAAVAGKIYVAGGWTTDYADTLGSVEVFDPTIASAGWTFMPNLTMPRGDCETALLDDRTFMVIGGVDADGNFTASVETMDVTADRPQWTARAPMLKPRGDFAAEALPGGRVVVMGGETKEGQQSEYALYQVEEYQASSDRWVQKAPLPEARFRFDTAHVGERVYVFGGQPTCSSKPDAAKDDCVKVALDTVWGYFDVEYPDVYAVVKD